MGQLRPRVVKCPETFLPSILVVPPERTCTRAALLPEAPSPRLEPEFDLLIRPDS